MVYLYRRNHWITGSHLFKDGREDIGIIKWVSDDDKEDEDGNPIYGFELVDKDMIDKYSFCEDETKSITIIE